MTELEIIAANEYLAMIAEILSGESDPIDKIKEIKSLVGDWGCTDRQAQNYDKNAKYDDGSCIYTVTPGNED